MKKTKQFPNPDMETFLKNTNFKLLKKQKLSLIKLIEKQSGVSNKTLEHLDGILNFIDTIQDIAVDEYGYKEKDVFNISKTK